MEEKAVSREVPLNNTSIILHCKNSYENAENTHGGIFHNKDNHINV